MITITYPSNTVEAIDSIRGAIGRDVIFYIPVTTTCSACSYDPVNDTSTNSFCPVCSGEWYIYSYSGISISGHITWGHSDQLGWVSAGQMVDGDCRVQIKYTSANLNTANTAKFLAVDGKKMKVNRQILRGVKEINRILLDLVELEKEL